MGKISKIIWLIPIFVLAISIFGAKSALADCFDEPAMITAGGDISPDGGIPLDPRENCSNPGLESRETTFKLTPTADSDIILDSVELDTSVEGENYIRVSGTREATGVRRI